MVSARSSILTLRDSGLRTFSKFRAERLDASDMFKAGLNETCETLEAVRIDGGTRCNVAGKDRDDRAALEVGNHVHADSTGGLTTLFHCHQNESRSSIFELPAPTQPGLLTANPRVINLNLAVQGFPSRTHHRPAELVKHHPRGLVAGQAELPLQKQGGDSPFVSGHQIRRPKPTGQGGSSSDAGRFQMSTKLGVGNWRTDAAPGSPIHRLAHDRNEGN